jgi:2-alkyl-3-oxoalkanoate reductase
MGPISIIGAGGFVGTCLVESLVLGGASGVRAIVRAYRSYASLSRFGPAITMRVADAQDPASLLPAIQGSSTVVNLTTGVPSEILRTTQAIYAACAAGGVKRLIHLSSAVVYGEVPSSEVNDDSPPDTRHWMPYARSKAASEIWLRKQIAKPSFQVAVLRPGIVWGPRSPHTLTMVKMLLDKNAGLVDGGKGIFNSIYIDNLIDCIRACHNHSADITGFYNVSDQETVTWRDFYAALAAHLGCDVDKLPNVRGDRFPWSVGTMVDLVRSFTIARNLSDKLKAKLPDHTKAKLKAILAGRYNYEGIAQGYATKPAIDREFWSLQQTKHKLPTTKFQRRFDFTPRVSFEEGVLRTIRWLSFLGYVPHQTTFSSNGASH